MKLRFSGEAAGPAAKASEAEEQRQRDKQQEYKQQKQRGKPRDHPAAKASSGGSGSGAAKRPQGSGGGKQLVRSGQQSKEERRHRGGTSLTAVTALGTVAVYAGVRGGIAAFHHARRHFLTRLLHDLSAALHALNATWWLDFGRWVARCCSWRGPPVGHGPGGSAVGGAAAPADAWPTCSAPRI